MKEKTVIKLWAMSLIGALQAINMFVSGMDNIVFTTIIAAITGLAGYELAKVKK